MINLLQETISFLKKHGKDQADVLWCGNSEFYFSWNVFVEMANAEYDNGYGGNQVALDLKIVGKDFWLERNEYDGSEWWEYKEFPSKPNTQASPDSLFSGYSDLKYITKDEK